MATILIIEDNDRLRRTLKLVVESAGHRVLEADEGTVGLQLQQEHQPDLVITDIIMPDKEGIETIMELRRLSADIPIIAISGSDMIGSVDFLHMAMELGANSAMRKPVGADDLLAEINKLLSASA